MEVLLKEKLDVGIVLELELLVVIGATEVECNDSEAVGLDSVDLWVIVELPVPLKDRLAEAVSVVDLD